MNKKIDDLLQLLILGDEADKPCVLTTLSTFKKPMEIDYVYDHLAYRGTSQGIHWLGLYLLKINSDYAIEKFLLLPASDKKLVREVSLSLIEQFPEEDRIDILLRLLEIDNDEDICFAANYLGGIKDKKVVRALIKALERYKERPGPAIELIKALGRLVAAKAFPLLKQLVSETNDIIIQETCFRALARFTYKFDKSYFNLALQSENDEIRELTYLSILNRQGVSWEKFLADKLTYEKVDKVRFNVLSSVNEIKSYQLFKLIFDLAVSDPSEQIKMVAKGAIKSVHSATILKWVAKQRQNCKDVPLLLEFLIEYADQSLVFKIIKDYCLCGDDEKIKLLAFEYMGMVTHPKAVIFLLSAIKANDDYSYAAANALRYVLSPEHWSILEQLLDLDVEKYNLIIQLFLHFVLYLPVKLEMPQSIKDTIEKHTLSPFSKIRYLAVRCYVRFASDKQVHYLLDMASNDRSYSVYRAVVRSLSVIVWKDVTKILELLKECEEFPRFYAVVYNILADSSLDFDNYNKVFKIVLGQAIEGVRTQTIKGLYPMVLLRMMATKHKAMFMDCFASENWNNEEQLILMRIINSAEIVDTLQSSTDFMIGHYKTAARDTKIEYLDFFGKVPDNSQIRETVFKSLTQEEDPAVRNKIHDVIYTWIKRKEKIYAK